MRDSSAVGKVALVHCLELPEPDPDQGILIDSLDHAGVPAEWTAWDDPAVDWAAFQLVMIRSTWNYHLFPTAFSAWLGRVAKVVTILNDRSLIAWNLHKRYLFELQDKGIPIVETALLTPSEPVRLDTVLQQNRWDRFVLKPATSAGSFLTESFLSSEKEEAERFLAKIHERGDALVQEYVPSVELEGEINLIHIEGQLTHGVIKRPRFWTDHESVSDAVQPTTEQRILAKQVMECVPGPTLYARVDLMLSHGRWILSELELIEPSLFFLQHPLSLEVFVASVRNRLRN